MINFEKIAKQKLNLWSEGIYTMTMYTMRDEAKIVAALLYKYKEIRYTCLT